MPKPNPRRRSDPTKGKAAKPGAVAVQQTAGVWAFVHPREVDERAEDLAEVREMIEAGELDVAVDELRWLLSACSDFIEAHAMLGELAVEMTEDVELARGHFGYAFQLGERALDRTGKPRPLPGAHPANRAWFEAARGLAWCFEKLGRPTDADGVLAIVRRCDPSDPSGVGSLLDSMRSGGLPIVELGGP
ncbi:MAG: tetratricopeptide repeat protein [Lacipirellulaceae bacterium]